MKEVNLDVSEGVGTVVLREGVAPSLVEKKGFTYSGNIKSVADWVEGKKANQYKFENSNATLLVGDKSLELILSEDTPLLSTKVEGQLKTFADLLKFGINQEDKIYTNKQLSRLLKMNRFYFPDKDENMQIVTNLNKFKASVTRELEDSNDFKGNKKILFEEQIKSDLKLSFKLSIPLFEGEENKTFAVDINFDITDARVGYWLESADLRELEMSERNKIIDREVGRLAEFARVTS